MVFTIKSNAFPKKSYKIIRLPACDNSFRKFVGAQR
jgi:hypothetical protein